VTRQKLIPGLVGFSTHTDCAYLRIMHSLSARQTSGGGSVSRLKYVLRTLDFELLIQHYSAGRWELAEQQIAAAVASLQGAGADFALLCANTGYALLGHTREQVGLPVLDIAAPVCKAIKAANCSVPGLLSTLKTHESGVYQARAAEHGLQILQPSRELSEAMQALILDELVGGRISEAGLQKVRDAVASFRRAGADCVILGCTDLTHLVEPLSAAGGVELPLFDSTYLHAQAAVDLAASGSLQGQ
jgi:aspartate racemase